MSIGVWQVVIILVIVLIIFGAGKLPHVMGDVAKGIKNFKSGMADEETDSAKNLAARSEEAASGNSGKDDGSQERRPSTADDDSGQKDK